MSTLIFYVIFIINKAIKVKLFHNNFWRLPLKMIGGGVNPKIQPVVVSFCPLDLMGYYLYSYNIANLI